MNCQNWAVRTEPADGAPGSTASARVTRAVSTSTAEDRRRASQISTGTCSGTASESRTASGV